MTEKPNSQAFADEAMLGLVRDCMTAINELITALTHLMIQICAEAGVHLNDPSHRRADASAPFTVAKEARLPVFLLFD